MREPARWLVALLLCAGPGMVSAQDQARRGLGTQPAAATLAALDSAIGPRGEELPAGRGRAGEGAGIYAAKCAMCHGANGHEGPDAVLVGGRGSLSTAAPLLTVGSFWPYATTVFDYIRRSMPFVAPGSLTADETYAVTAYLLAANGIIAPEVVIDRDSLPAVAMPNRAGFVPDPRPDVRAADEARAGP